MNARTLQCLIVSLLAAALPVQATSYRLVWSDEFESGTLDESSWTRHAMPGSETGNQELQYYTGKPENSRVENGMLVIEARQERHEGHEYTSARLNTKGKRDFRYGRIEARIKVPSGQGMWPAFWLMPTKEVYGSWAASGEIDVMEVINAQPVEVTGSIHFGGMWPRHKYLNGQYRAEADGRATDFSRDFHVYAVEWTPFEFHWYVDGKRYATQDSWTCDAAPFPAPFDQEFYLIFNLAVGGQWPGPPNETTRWPQQMLVDWVRVYQAENAPPAVKLNSPLPNTLIRVGGPISISATATDPDGNLSHVEFFLGKTLIAKDTSAPFECSVRPAPGYHRIRARAVDTTGFARSDEVYIAFGREALRAPFHGVPAVLPGRIEAEDFDEGVPGVAFVDHDTINPEGAYRFHQPVEVLRCREGGYKVGWMDTGEWLAYSVTVGHTGSYDLILRVSSDNGKGILRIEADGRALGADIQVPKTAGWEEFVDVRVPAVSLEEGAQTIRLRVIHEGVNVNYMDVVSVAPAN